MTAATVAHFVTGEKFLQFFICRPKYYQRPFALSGEAPWSVTSVKAFSHNLEGVSFLSAVLV